VTMSRKKAAGRAVKAALAGKDQQCARSRGGDVRVRQFQRMKVRCRPRGLARLLHRCAAGRRSAGGLPPNVCALARRSGSGNIRTGSTTRLHREAAGGRGDRISRASVRACGAPWACPTHGRAGGPQVSPAVSGGPEGALVQLDAVPRGPRRAAPNFELHGAIDDDNGAPALNFRPTEDLH